MNGGGAGQMLFGLFDLPRLDFKVRTALLLRVKLVDFNEGAVIAIF